MGARRNRRRRSTDWTVLPRVERNNFRIWWGLGVGGGAAIRRVSAPLSPNEVYHLTFTAYNSSRRPSSLLTRILCKSRKSQHRIGGVLDENSKLFNHFKYPRKTSRNSISRESDLVAGIKPQRKTLGTDFRQNGVP